MHNNNILWILAIYFVFWIQNIESKQILQQQDAIDINSIDSWVFVKELEFENLFSISDEWNKIKGIATKAWDSVKHIASTTKEKIDEWIGNVKNHADDVKENLKDRLKELKVKFGEIVQDILKTEEEVQKCLGKENEVIDAILREIIQSVTDCIAGNLSKTSLLNHHKSQVALNDTDFYKKVDDNVEYCITKSNNVETCLNTARKEVFDYIENSELEVLKRRVESRGVTDDLLESIVTCSVIGLIEASGAITGEVIKIIECVSNSD